MPVLKPRSRLVSLRLTDEEYQSLVRASRTEGARSTSDLARNAICDFLTRCAPPACESGTQERINQLESELRRIKRMLETITSFAKEQD